MVRSLLRSTQRLKLQAPTFYANHDQRFIEVTMIEHPRCDTCSFVLPSYSSPSGLRCGLQYHKANILLRKLRAMDFYPTVRADNACEHWTLSKHSNEWINHD